MGVSLPILYKNFVVDEYQLFQARYCGASAVLLIASVLTIDECRRLMSLAHQLGLEVLLEMHAESELDYAALEPDMYGILELGDDAGSRLHERPTHRGHGDVEHLLGRHGARSEVYRRVYRYFP